MLRDGLRLLVAEVRFVAGRGDPAALAVGEARRKLAYAPPFPDRRYAEKLARCVQALLRHTV